MIAPINFIKLDKLGVFIKLFLSVFILYGIIFINYNKSIGETWSICQWQKKDKITILKVPSLGNQTHTKIVQTILKEGLDGKDKCEWLKENAHRFDKKIVKATQKAWGCRHSRVSKDKKQRKKK